MEITSKDILNLTCAVRIVKIATNGQRYTFTEEVKSSMKSALQETIDAYRKQLKESKEV